eukprot:454285_1
MTKSDIWKRPGYISLPLITVTTLIMIILFIHMYQNAKQRLPSKTIYIGYASVLFYIMYGINIFILSIYNISTNESDYSGLICPFGFTHPLYFTAAKILMFLFYLFRLYEMFNGTSSAYSLFSFKIF